MRRGEDNYVYFKKQNAIKSGWTLSSFDVHIAILLGGWL
jgi:hypothetical protein